MTGWRAIIAMFVILGLVRPVMADDFLSGAALYRDVARYASFGMHRFGSRRDGGGSHSACRGQGSGF